MLDSPECNKLFVSAIALWSEKRNRRKLPPKLVRQMLMRTLWSIQILLFCLDLFPDAVDTSIDVLLALGLSKCQEDSECDTDFHSDPECN
ncbi:unnamed protein product [Porites evermanni]|uniref:Uncharacterized protein n=1 Tax=Porites evermanni TaxID=104178 RepID=A0ABN8QUT8_9CNID|nr:unnamed protein product [Porites evermanni]